MKKAILNTIMILSCLEVHSQIIIEDRTRTDSVVIDTVLQNKIKPDRSSKMAKIIASLFKVYWAVDGHVLTMGDNGEVVPVHDAVVYAESVSDSTINQKKVVDCEDGNIHMELSSKKDVSDYHLHVYVQADGYIPFHQIYEPKLNQDSLFDIQKVDLGVVLLKRKEK